MPKLCTTLTPFQQHSFGSAIDRISCEDSEIKKTSFFHVMCGGVDIVKLRQDGDSIINIEDLFILFVVCHIVTLSTHYLCAKRGDIYIIITMTIKLPKYNPDGCRTKNIEIKISFRFNDMEMI